MQNINQTDVMLILLVYSAVCLLLTRLTTRKHGWFDASMTNAQIMAGSAWAQTWLCHVILRHARPHFSVEGMPKHGHLFAHGREDTLDDQVSPPEPAKGQREIQVQ